MGGRDVGEATERPVANGGPGRLRPSVLQSGRRNSNKAARGSVVRQPPEDTGMEFRNVCVDAHDKRILWDVSGKAVPGQMLAVMGPSGEPCSASSSALRAYIKTCLSAKRLAVLIRTPV